MILADRFSALCDAKWSSRAAILLLLLAGVILLSELVAGFVPPPAVPLSVQVASATELAEDLAAVRLFSVSEESGRKVPDTGYELLGVLSDGHSGMAILRRHGEVRAEVFAAGAVLPGDLTLMRIERDAVVLARAGKERRLLIRQIPRSAINVPPRPSGGGGRS